MRNLFLLLLSIPILSACAGMGEPAEPPAYTVIKPGMTLQVKETLTIPSHLARVYFQNGRILSKLEVNQYYPSCNILSYVVSDKTQEIKPDIFEILKVTNMTELVQQDFPVLASSGLVTLDLFDKDNAPMAEIFITRLNIQSQKNPDIKRFECLAWRKPLLGRHLSIADIRQSLGEIIELHI